MKAEEYYDQSSRLLAIATKWFQKGAEAFDRGDKSGSVVARLAHRMTRSAHDDLMAEYVKNKAE